MYSRDVFAGATFLTAVSESSRSFTPLVTTLVPRRQWTMTGDDSVSNENVPKPIVGRRILRYFFSIRIRKRFYVKKRWRHDVVVVSASNDPSVRTVRGAFNRDSWENVLENIATRRDPRIAGRTARIIRGTGRHGKRRTPRKINTPLSRSADSRDRQGQTLKSIIRIFFFIFFLIVTGQRK